MTRFRASGVKKLLGVSANTNAVHPLINSALIKGSHFTFPGADIGVAKGSHCARGENKRESLLT